MAITKNKSKSTKDKNKVYYDTLNKLVRAALTNTDPLTFIPMNELIESKNIMLEVINKALENS